MTINPYIWPIAFSIFAILFAFQSVVFMRLSKKFKMRPSSNEHEYLLNKIKFLEKEVSWQKDCADRHYHELRSIRPTPITKEEIDEEFGSFSEHPNQLNSNYQPTIRDLINYLSPPSKDFEICQDICSKLQKSNEHLKAENDELQKIVAKFKTFPTSEWENVPPGQTQI